MGTDLPRSLPYLRHHLCTPLSTKPRFSHTDPWIETAKLRITKKGKGIHDSQESAKRVLHDVAYLNLTYEVIASRSRGSFVTYLVGFCTSPLFPSPFCLPPTLPYEFQPFFSSFESKTARRRIYYCGDRFPLIAQEGSHPSLDGRLSHHLSVSFSVSRIPLRDRQRVRHHMPFSFLSVLNYHPISIHPSCPDISGGVRLRISSAHMWPVLQPVLSPGKPKVELSPMSCKMSRKSVSSLKFQHA